MFDPYIKLFSNPQFIFVFRILYKTAFIWFPVLLFWTAWEMWIDYRRAQFFAKQTYILLEIKIPKDVFKSPQAAEFFINSLYNNVGEGNWHEIYWKGQTRPWFSLEIVSIEGEIHFFVWTRKGERNKIEANLYSQYPGIEIYEVPDYTLSYSYDPEKYSVWASEYDLTDKDYLPIKTYIDYGLDRDPKEEYKIDPLTPLIEFLGSIGRGQQIWIQFLIRSHKKEDIDPKTGELVDQRWKKDAQKAIEEINIKAKGEKGEDGKIIPGTGRFLTKGETDKISAIERSVSKNGFDVGIRTVYFAEKESFNPSNIGGIIGGITHFNSSLNGFKPARGSASKYKNFLLLWKDRPSKKTHTEKKRLFDAYKRRAYFYRPWKSPHFVLNTEELATLYHFPGGVATTPTFSRIMSKKAEAPSNLPF